MANINPLDPTFRGYVASTLDALILFESCLNGQLNHVPRRPHDRERQDLIASGNIFIYEEHASGIKRWTDGISWSPSRILHNFLVYRELDKPFPPGEKKRALKKKRPPNVGKTDGVSRPGPSSSIDKSSGKDVERAFVGSLVDSYSFKDDGLVKKTISINYQGVPHHLVSYYNLSDVQSGRLVTPSKHPICQNTVPRTELLLSQNFRSPIDEIDYDDRGALSSLITMSLPVASFSAISSSNYDALSPYGFSQQAEQPSAQHQAQPHQMQHQMQPHHHQLQLHFQLEQQHAHLPHQTHQAHQTQPQHQLPQLQLPHHQLSQHQLTHHQLQQHQLPEYQLSQHQTQSQHQDQPQPHSQHQNQHQHQQHQHQQHQQQQHQHQHQHQHQPHQSHQSHQPHQSQHRQHAQHSQHHYQNSYSAHSGFISSAAPNGMVSHGSYIPVPHQHYTSVPWAMDEIEKGEPYFDESHTSDEPSWWPDSGDPKAGHGPEENRH